MAFDRSIVKAKTIASSASDKELDEALSSGHLLQLRLQQDANAHELAMKGRVGRFFGEQVYAATFAAYLAIVVGLIGAAYCLVQGASPENADAAEYWGKHLERAVAFATAALSYLFGKGNSGKD